MLLKSNAHKSPGLSGLVKAAVSFLAALSLIVGMVIPASANDGTGAPVNFRPFGINPAALESGANVVPVPTQHGGGYGICSDAGLPTPQANDKQYNSARKLTALAPLYDQSFGSGFESATRLGGKARQNALDSLYDQYLVPFDQDPRRDSVINLIRKSTQAIKNGDYAASREYNVALRVLTSSHMGGYENFY
ncbi:hypothetical protein Clow_01998 [Corynebacterium lowii]|uniref:Uncharacterized protein n=1 Tax=Corynebacterium lowii TaxID=1544413 RepID=A0A0Q1DWZ7_9CORY|nr:hypothetical protein Clow_01998 [Corynebacterium lowii]MDP9851646.1 hypothetical protein [Corynebacterium lowii]